MVLEDGLSGGALYIGKGVNPHIISACQLKQLLLCLQVACIISDNSEWAHHAASFRSSRGAALEIRNFLSVRGEAFFRYLHSLPETSPDRA